MPSKEPRISVPAALHEVLGEHTTVRDIGAIVIACAATLGAAGWLSEVPLSPRSALGWLLVADIAAGTVANLSRGTNDFYARRPRGRWLFIAIHAHILVAAWAFQAPLAPALYVWATTMGAATLVNLHAGRPAQKTIAGAALTVCAAVLAWAAREMPPAMALVSGLFMLKVVFSFAVDHWPQRDMHIRGVHVLGDVHRDAFAALMADAFARDPLFVQLFETDVSTRTTFAGQLFDLNRAVGGTPVGLFHDGALVAAALLEPPQRGVARFVGQVASLATALSMLWRLGWTRARLLNTYHLQSRAQMPRDAHHYLVLLGVAGHAQGQGYGSKMLNVVDELLDEAPGSAGVGLDTERAANVPYYERRGFQLLHTSTLAPGIEVFHMWKPRPRV